MNLLARAVIIMCFASVLLLPFTKMKRVDPEGFVCLCWFLNMGQSIAAH